jgi:hypothetical protein
MKQYKRILKETVKRPDYILSYISDNGQVRLVGNEKNQDERHLLDWANKELSQEEWESILLYKQTYSSPYLKK